MPQFAFLTSSKKYVLSEGDSLTQAFSAIVADPKKGHGRISSVVVYGGVAAYVDDQFEAFDTRDVIEGKELVVKVLGLKRPLKEGVVLLTLEEINRAQEAVIAAEGPVLANAEAAHQEAQNAFEGAKAEGKSEKDLKAYEKTVMAAKSEVDAVRSRIDAAYKTMSLAKEAVEVFRSILPKGEETAQAVEVPKVVEVPKTSTTRRHRKKSAA